MRTLLEFASTSYKYTVLDVPRSDAAKYAEYSEPVGPTRNT